MSNLEPQMEENKIILIKYIGVLPSKQLENHKCFAHWGKGWDAS